jgi:hypothetical protein
MERRSATLLLGACLWACAGCAAGTAGRQELLVGPELVRFHDFVDHLDLADERYRLEANHGDGSSVYLKLHVPDGSGGYRIWGAIVAEQSGTVVRAEVFQYALATLLGVGYLEGPGRLLWLRGQARDRVVRTIAAADYSRDNDYRKRHQRAFLDHAAGHDTIEAVAKVWGPPPYDAGFLVRREALDETQPLARFLKADQPPPTSAPMSLPGIPGQSTELALARELSDIFVIDAMANQRDRFSGGNLQAIAVPEGEGTRVQFVSYDNGDALDRADRKWIDVYLRLVTRFDRRLAENLFALEDFLQGRAPQFRGFRQEADLQQALGLAGRSDYWAVFRRNLTLMVAHIRAVPGDKYFREERATAASSAPSRRPRTAAAGLRPPPAHGSH